jgi:hypothetical protein
MSHPQGGGNDGDAAGPGAGHGLPCPYVTYPVRAFPCRYVAPEPGRT